MFSIIPVLSIVLVAVSSASGLILPHHRSINLEVRATQPKTWATGYLEDYQVYHARYLALKCQDKHKTKFFDQCCHPLLATENLKDNRPAKCRPNAAALASASSTYPTSTVEPGSNGNQDCDEPSSSTPTSTHKASPTPAPPKSPKSSSLSSSKKHTPTPTSSKPKPTSDGSSNDGSSNDGSSNGGLAGLIKGGIATFFTQNGVAGACGTVHKDSDIICALDTPTFANGKHCGQKVAITNLKTGKTVNVLVADECPTCKNAQSIDLSTGAYHALGGIDNDGIFDIAWKFI